MGGETFVVGSLIFNGLTPEKTKLMILEELAGVIEVELSDIRYDIVSGKWEFQGINWDSHIYKEGIEGWLEQWKGYIKNFKCSLHHLSDPEQINYREIPKEKED